MNLSQNCNNKNNNNNNNTGLWRGKETELASQLKSSTLPFPFFRSSYSSSWSVQPQEPCCSQMAIRAASTEHLPTDPTGENREGLHKTLPHSTFSTANNVKCTLAKPRHRYLLHGGIPTENFQPFWLGQKNLFSEWTQRACCLGKRGKRMRSS